MPILIIVSASSCRFLTMRSGSAVMAKARDCTPVTTTTSTVRASQYNNSVASNPRTIDIHSTGKIHVPLLGTAHGQNPPAIFKPVRHDLSLYSRHGEVSAHAMHYPRAEARALRAPLPEPDLNAAGTTARTLISLGRFVARPP